MEVPDIIMYSLDEAVPLPTIAAVWLGMEAAKTSDLGAIILGFRIPGQFFEGPLEEYKATASAGAGNHSCSLVRNGSCQD